MKKLDFSLTLNHCATQPRFAILARASAKEKSTDAPAVQATRPRKKLRDRDESSKDLCVKFTDVSIVSLVSRQTRERTIRERLWFAFLEGCRVAMFTHTLGNA